VIGGTLLVLALSGSLPLQDTVGPYARAESLLVEGELRAARQILERAVRGNRDDALAITLLGRVHLAWPVVGRFKAWDLFQRAAALDSANPEPRYLQAKVGEFLGGDDGERLIRDALYHVWRLDPDSIATHGRCGISCTTAGDTCAELFRYCRGTGTTRRRVCCAPGYW
jgi:hypothetical protein